MNLKGLERVAGQGGLYLEVIVGVLVCSFLRRRTITREVLSWPLSEGKPPDVMPLRKAQTDTLS